MCAIQERERSESGNSNVVNGIGRVANGAANQ